MMKLALLRIFAFTAVLQMTRAQSCDMEQIEPCGFLLFGGDLTKYKIPITTDEFHAWCKDMRNASKCIHEYTHRCLKPVEVEKLVDKVTTEVQDQASHFCDEELDEEFMKELLSHAPCIKLILDALGKCIVKYMGDLEAIANQAAPENISPTYCCYYFDFKSCYVETGHKDCPDESNEYLIEKMEMTATRLLEETCTAPPSQCASLPPLDRSKPPKRKSLLTSTIDVLKKIYS